MIYHFDATGKLVAILEYEADITEGQIVVSEELWEVGKAKLIEGEGSFHVVPDFFVNAIAVSKQNEVYRQKLEEAFDYVRGLKKAVVDSPSSQKRDALLKWEAYRDELFGMRIDDVESIVWPEKPLLFDC